MDGYRITNARTARDFVFAGKARFTLKSLKSGKHATFKVKTPRKPPNEQSPITHFVSVRDDADGIGSYSYLGTINRDGVFWHGRKSMVPEDDFKTTAARWLFNQLANNNLPDTCQLWHEGRCGRCGRRLTVPESIASGIGPECAAKSAGKARSV